MPLSRTKASPSTMQEGSENWGIAASSTATTIGIRGLVSVQISSVQEFVSSDSKNIFLAFHMAIPSVERLLTETSQSALPREAGSWEFCYAANSGIDRGNFGKSAWV